MNGQDQRCRIIIISALTALGLLSACFEGWPDGHSCLQDGDCASGRCRSSVCVPQPADPQSYYDAGPGAAGSGGTAGSGGASTGGTGGGTTSAGGGGQGGAGGSTGGAGGSTGGAGGSTGGSGGTGGT